jgi:uncharacterized OsmC-like protein
MTTIQPSPGAPKPSGGTFVDLAASEHPLAFVATAGSGQTVTGPSGSWSYRAEVIGLGGFQKECLIEDLASGRVWRLAADEPNYRPTNARLAKTDLGGTGLAPMPLMHWMAGLHGDVTARVAGLLQEEGIDFDALDVVVSQRFSSEGSFAKGEAIARAHDLEVAVHLVGVSAEADLSPTVERALETSPAIAALLNAAEGAFALFVRGRSVPVEGVPQSTAPTQTDPFLRHAAQPRPVVGLNLNPNLQTTRTPGTDSGVSLSDNQSGAVGWRVQARGSYDLDTRLVESTVGFPELAATGTWNLVSDASNEAAPSGLAYFSAGTAFCYHTQLCRYAHVRRMEIERPRLVQASDFSSTDGGGVAGAVDTQLFLSGSLGGDAASSLLTAAVNTCYAHRALGVAIERPAPVVTTSTEAGSGRSA